MSGSQPMSIANVQAAYALIGQLTDLQSRVTQVSRAATLGEIYETLVGTGLESNILDQSRTQVTAFLENAIQQVQSQLTALGVATS